MGKSPAKASEFDPGYAGPSIIVAILLAWAIIMVAGASQAMTSGTHQVHAEHAAHIQYNREVR